MRNRRGLSSVVGAIFFIIAATSAIVYVTHSMNLLDSFAQNVIVKQNTDMDRTKESVEITKAKIESNGKFNFTINNPGVIPVNVTKIWITQTNTSPQIPNSFTINQEISPNSSIGNIGQGISYAASTSNSYDLKIVTSRGNVVPFSLNSDVVTDLYTNLYATPTVISNTFTTTITLEVVNNLTSNDFLASISPVVFCSGTKLTYQSGPTPSSVDTLSRGDVARFNWLYQANGNDGDVVTCTGYLRSGGSPIGTVQITIHDPLFASESGTSLTSEGLTCCKTDEDTLAFHKEVLNVPNSGVQNNYQMYSGTAEGAGSTLNIRSLSPVSWFTNTDSSSSEIIPAGDWDLDLVYQSAFYPTSITTSASMAFFFESPTPTLDSEGSKNISTIQGAIPVSDCDKHGGGCYQFTSGDYLVVPYGSGINDIKGPSDSTTGWFKTTQTTRGTIYRIETTQTPQEYYEIAINTSGNLEFKSFTNGNDNNQLTCTSNNGSLRDDSWHFFAAVRTISGNTITCTLYVTNAAGTVSSTTANSNTGTGGGANKKEQVDVSNENTYIGINPGTPNQDGFVGYLGYIMHWNNDALTSQQVSDLSKKDYGDSSHKIKVTYQITDNSGNVLFTILSNQTATIPFGDGKNVLSGPQWKSYDLVTNLSNSTDPYGEFHINPNQRIQVKISWDDSGGTDTSLLDLNLDVDDFTYTNNIASRLIIPTPDTGFLSYYLWDTDNPITFTVGNAGPQGAWILFAGTRVTLEGNTVSGAYAALVKSVNATSQSANMDPNTDSNYLPVDSMAILEFYGPKVKPDIQSSTDIVTNNQYRMYVSVVGYDTTGRSVFKTFNVGLVSVCTGCT